MAQHRIDSPPGMVAVAAWFAALSVMSVAAVAADHPLPHQGPAATGQYQAAPRAAWCADHDLAKLTMAQRLEGRNLERLRRAQAELAPGFEAGNAKTGLHLMAAYQEELEKRHPDPATAASYLALAAAVPISAVRVRQVNALLCISSTAALARTIQTEAEQQRERMNR